MAHKLANRAKMTVSGTPGTGAITLLAAAAGFDTFANAGVSDGDTVSYFAEDGDAWEYGVGTYASSGPTLTRTTVGRSSAGAGTPATLTAGAVVGLTALASDIDGRAKTDGSNASGTWPVSVSGAAASVSGATSNGFGTRTVSTSDPSGGSDGDIWYKVSA